MTDWFVRNVRDMQWQENELGATAEFDRPGASTRSAST